VGSLAWVRLSQAWRALVRRVVFFGRSLTSAPLQLGHGRAVGKVQETIPDRRWKLPRDRDPASLIKRSRTSARCNRDRFSPWALRLDAWDRRLLGRQPVTSPLATPVSPPAPNLQILESVKNRLPTLFCISPPHGCTLAATRTAATAPYCTPSPTARWKSGPAPAALSLRRHRIGRAR
jgi:hypothetical protein